MAKVYDRLQIDVNTRSSAVISAVQKDAKSRYLDVVLLDGAMALNLTGHEVRIYRKKAECKEFYNNGEITDATAGFGSITMSRTMCCGGRGSGYTTWTERG